ncbi:MAG: SprT-like domain-containing protein [Muribaculaceae bacterium]|nr:SprT-like domain-containing protein [Muribaculaceae bacterium]MCF0214762.1 SprT-like domain-containing protein [Muribaculaceae bacterium]
MRITKEDIKARYDVYNDKYFGGVLQPCKYHVAKEKSSALGLYNPVCKNGKIIGHIWIAYHVDWSEEDLQEVIIHEMIHHYVQTVEGHKGGLLGHNWRFRRQCRRLKKDYGLIIHIYSFNVCRIGQKKPTNLFQKIRRFLWR